MLELAPDQVLSLTGYNLVDLKFYFFSTETSAAVATGTLGGQGISLPTHLETRTMTLSINSEQ